MNNRILIIEKDKEAARLRKDILEFSDFNYHCYISDSMLKVGSILQNKSITTLLVDKDLEDSNFYRDIKKFKTSFPHMRIILMAKTISPEEALKAREHYVDEFCEKNDDYPSLINAIEEVI